MQMKRNYHGHSYFSPFMLWGDLATKTLEMMLASAQVIGHRTGRMVLAGLAPNARDRHEFAFIDGTRKDRSGRTISSGDGRAHDDREPAVAHIDFPPSTAELCGVHVVGQQPNAKPVDRAASRTRASAGTIRSHHGGRFKGCRQAHAPRAEAHPRQGHRKREAAWKALTSKVVGVRAAAESEWARRPREIL